jgi:ADP-heptose:LPS heptosyltransferase
MTRMTSTARPLIMRCGALGDMVLLTPMIRRLAERYGTVVDLVSSGPWTMPLLAGQPGVGEIHLLESRRRPYWLGPDQWRVVRALRQVGPRPTWFMDNAGIGRHLLTRAGIGEEWIVDAQATPRHADEHLIERFDRIARQVPRALGGGDAKADAVRGAHIVVSESARVDLQHWLTTRQLANRPLLLVQAGNKRTMRRGDRRRKSNTKYWPEDRWAAVIDRLAALHPDHSILLLGVPSESALNEDILARVRTGRAINVASDLPIPRLSALLEQADAMVTVDTGPAHIGAAVGLPMLVLFGQVEPSLYRPWGLPEAFVRCLAADPTGPLDGLSVDAVLTSLADLPLRRR